MARAWLRKAERAFPVFTAAGLLLVGALALLPVESLRGAGSAWFVTGFTLAWFGYALACARLGSAPPPLPWLWGVAVLLRLAALASRVPLSDDVYRYIWDGHLLVSGVNPYSHAVLSPLLDEYATPLRALVNFPHLATPYLPAAQAYFALVEWIAPQQPGAFRVGAALLDLATGLVIFRSLSRVGIDRRAALLYLWNPLVALESGNGAHVDALMAFLTVAALACLFPRRGETRAGALFSAALLALAVLTKGWPLLAAPLLLRRWGGKGTLLFGSCVALPLAGFAWGAGWGLSGPPVAGVFGTVRAYSAAWSFNSGLFLPVAWLLGEPVARLMSVALSGAAALALAARGWQTALSGANLARRVALPVGLYLLLAPTVHPWYLLLPLALLPFFWDRSGDGQGGRAWVWAWVYLTLLSGCTYVAYSGLAAPGWLAWAQIGGYVPFWGLLAYAVYKGRGRRLFEPNEGVGESGG